MKYALLIYPNPGSHEALSQEEYAGVFAEYMALRAAPGFIDGAQLAPGHATTTVRVAEGETLVTDGPFAETKDVIGGYFLFDVDNLDQALELAARIPAARLGGAVEIRPLVDVAAEAPAAA